MTASNSKPNWKFYEENTETGKKKNDTYEDLWKDVYKTLISEKVNELYKTTHEDDFLLNIKSNIFSTHSDLIGFFQQEKPKNVLKESLQLKNLANFTNTLKIFLTTVESESGKLWLALFQQIQKKIEKITSFGNPKVEVVTEDKGKKPDGGNKWEKYNGIEIQRLNDSDDGTVNYNIKLDLKVLNSSPKREEQFDKTSGILGSFFASKLIPKRYNYTLNVVNEESVSVNGKNQTVAESMTDMISLLAAKMYNLDKEIQKIAYHEVKGTKIVLTTRPVSQSENDQWKEALNIFANAFKK